MEHGHHDVNERVEVDEAAVSGVVWVFAAEGAWHDLIDFRGNLPRFAVRRHQGWVGTLWKWLRNTQISSSEPVVCIWTATLPEHDIRRGGGDCQMPNHQSGFRGQLGE